MNRVGTLVWALLLSGSIVAVVLGFAGGRSIGSAAVARLHPAPATLPSPPVVRDVPRALTGPHSLENAEDDRDPYDEADGAVAVRSPGWAPPQFDSRHDRGRVALVVVDAGVAGTPARAFIDSPIAFTLVVPVRGDGGALHDGIAAGKAVLADATGADAAAIAATMQRGARGAVGSFAKPAEARRAARALGPADVALDSLLADGDAFYRAARTAGVPAVTRDVIADGRDADPYLDYLFRSALEIAKRTGVATVALHARPQSYAAAERFAVRAQREGVDVVSIEQLVPDARRRAAAAPVP